MTIPSTKMLSMYAQVLRGTPKADSHLVTDDETSAMWDKLAANHAELKAKHPGATFEIPNDPDFSV